MDLLLSAVVALFLFVMGATIGSFLNVVIYRLPRGESIAHPGSHCPRCGRALTWWPPDLIPILSWLILQRRCRSCGAGISARYAGVELLTACLFVAAGWNLQFVPSLALLHHILFIGLAIPIIFIDQDHRIVPDELSAPLFALGLAWNVVEGVSHHPWLVTVVTHGAPYRFDISLPTSLVFAPICAGIFWLIRWFGEIVFKKEAMGLAFGPALMVGALVMLLFPQIPYHLVDWYRGFLP
ncbi:MAG: prepilin peptidase [Chloroflexi bacterium]|nr:prepilin peptidase [Chloroflexota bacterium]